MPSRQDCLDDIAKRTGRSRKEVDDILGDILDRAEGFEHDGMSPDESYARARDEKLEEIAERAALSRRAEILDTRKEIARHRFYTTSQEAIAKLSPRLAVKAAGLALEAKLVGVNLPFFKGRFSVDAQFVAMRRLWVGGMAKDLEDGGLLKLFATRNLEDKWTDELFELNRRDGGNPGVTKDPQALAIARIVQKWQTASMGTLNREGAWVRSYSGYITRSSHNPDTIRAAGPEQWVADTLPRLDLARTFGTTDRQRALDALRVMWTPMKDGNHFDYGRPVEEPLYPNVARQASDSRELHFKTAADWRAYNDKYGVSNPTQTVTQAMVIAARRAALLREFGSKPAESFERDIAWLKATLQQQSQRDVARLANIRDQETKAPGTFTDEIALLETSIAESSTQFTKFENFEQGLRNRFAQIDGSSMRPVNRAMANTVSNWMAIQRMAKLGRVAFTHFASLPTKAMEGRYWGIPLAERYTRLFTGMTQGLEGTAKRDALDATLVAFENRLGHMMAMYDVADAPAGFLAKWETTFFKLTGVSTVIDNQRGDSEAMFAAHLGGKRGQDWAAIGPKEQRVVQGFGLGEAEWKALHGIEWTKLGDRTYLFPSDALKLSDEQVGAYLREKAGGGIIEQALARREATPADIAKAREDLALQIATAYSDRAGYAVPMPNARIRAILFGKNFEPGTAMNAALKLVYQFKIWPADMITRAWGREMYGTIGDGRLDRMAGLVELAVGGIVFGVAAEIIRSALQGKDSLTELREHPFGAILKGGQRSGMGSIVGDFLLHNFNRHGMNAVEWMAGPTISQINTLLDMIHAGGETKAGMLSPAAMRQRGADLIRLVKDNTPFMSLWATSAAVDALIWHRLQEWINPGYLQRAERRAREERGTHFWLSPSKTDQFITGRRPATTPEGKWNLGNQ